MITEFDLHERTGVPLDRVRQWLRQHGFGGKAGQRISVELEQKFIEAHGQVAGRATRPISAVRPREASEAPPERVLVALDEATRQLRELQARHSSMETRALALQAELERHVAARHAAEAALAARTPPEVARPVREEARPRPAEEAPPSLREALEKRGLGGKQALDALRALVATDSTGERLLSGLIVSDPAGLDLLRPVCSVVTCREVAALRGFVVVPVSGAACSLCKGSDNRRWFRLMAARLEHAGRKRVLVVGGADDSRAELDRLAREETRVKIDQPTETRVDGARARALVKGADVIAFWVSTEISHAESQPFKDAARQDPGIIIAATAPGGRGVAALARAVIEALDTQAARPRDQA
jgi:hypothetical protein